jgi:hypothetical protein
VVTADITEALREQIEMKEHELNALRQALSVLEGGTVTAMPVPKSREFEHLGITAAVKQLYAETGEEMDTRQIADALMDRGIKTRSKNFVATVYATLDNNREFVRTDAGAWKLVTPKGK